jgi:hypothetical protein
MRLSVVFSCRKASYRVVNRFHWHHEPVSPPWQVLYIPGSSSMVPQRIPQLLDGDLQPQGEVYKCVRGPEPPLEFFMRHQFARTLQEGDQELKGLVLEFQAAAVSAQLPGAHVNLKATETVAIDCSVAALG